MSRITNQAQQPITDIDLAPPDGSRQVEHDGPPGATRPTGPPGSDFSSHRTESDLAAHLERAFRRGELSDADLKGTIGTEFQNRITELAQDREAFHAFFKGHFGATDAAVVEKTRQQILDGTYRPPDVRFVGSDVLGTARGAYDAEGQVIYLNRDHADPASGFEGLTRTFSEEMFEHFNHTLGDGNRAGDRGAKAMHALYGDPLSGEQIAALDAEDDTGTIRVNGRDVAVEFGAFNPIDLGGNYGLTAKEANVFAFVSGLELAHNARIGHTDSITEHAALAYAAHHYERAFEVDAVTANVAVNEAYGIQTKAWQEAAQINHLVQQGHPATSIDFAGRMQNVKAMIDSPYFQTALGAAGKLAGLPGWLVTSLGAAVSLTGSLIEGRTPGQATVDAALSTAGSETLGTASEWAGGQILQAFNNVSNNAIGRTPYGTFFSATGSLVGNILAGRASEELWPTIDTTPPTNPNPGQPLGPDLSIEQVEKIYLPESNRFLYRATVRNVGNRDVDDDIEFKAFFNGGDDGYPDRDPINEALRTGDPSLSRFAHTERIKHNLNLRPGQSRVLELSLSPRDRYSNGVLKIDGDNDLAERNELNNLKVIEFSRDDPDNRIPAPYNAPPISGSGEPGEVKQYRIGLGNFDTTLKWEADFFEIPDQFRFFTVDGGLIADLGWPKGRNVGSIRIQNADEVILEIEAGRSTTSNRRSAWFIRFER